MSTKVDTVMFVNNTALVAFYNREKNLKITLLIKQPKVQHFILNRRIVDSIR